MWEEVPVFGPDLIRSPGISSPAPALPADQVTFDPVNRCRRRVSHRSEAEITDRGRSPVSTATPTTHAPYPSPPNLATSLDHVTEEDLQAEAAALLARLERTTNAGDDELAAIDAFVGRAAPSADPDVVQAVAYARLWQATALIDAGRLQDATAVASALAAAFDTASDDQNLPALGLMLLDLGFLLLANELAGPLAALCEPVITRLEVGSPAGRAVAAGALFYRGQALSRLGRLDEAERESVTLHAMGEPALRALDRIDAQFGPEDRNTLWHAQIVVHRALVLLGLGRAQEARTILGHAGRTFARHDLPQELAEGIRVLEREIAADAEGS